MREHGRYNECVLQRGEDAVEFFSRYFSGRTVMVIAGAGFDPRACLAVKELVESGAQVQLRLIKECRPNPSEVLVQAAEVNLHSFEGLVPELELINLEIFDVDGALVGGRRAVTLLSQLATADVDDIVLDLSALSIGTSFPILRLLVERFARGEDQTNIHVTVAHDPAVDSSIHPILGDRPDWVHGFDGDLGLDREESLAKLWMPQLLFGGNQELGRIYDFVGPHDTCPIVPFPATDPRLADRLAVSFGDELLDIWAVDVRNLVYADEGDPLDVYRTILRIDDLREPVFAGSGGSAIVVSPTGSKLMALGALLACVERDLPVAYLEAEGYEIEGELRGDEATPNLVHLWLEGEAYLDNRSPLRRQG